MKDKIFSLLLMTLVSFGAWAQTSQVSGTVYDQQGQPFPGASVVVAGTTQGTVTDLDGNFTLKVDNAQQKQLSVTCIGFQSQTVSLAEQQTGLQITLVEEAIGLDEIVAVGYGSVKKKDLTGSVASVSGQDLVKTPVANVSEALSGKMAGVRITTTDGSPDAEVLIRVRGSSSITGDNSPLYVVDGFQVSSISDISPNDIEDITVLKDASTTAIYGSQGANGVVLITTKSAKEGKTQVNYNGYVQTKTISKRLDPMNTYDYVMSNYEYALLRGTSAVSSFEKQFGVYDDLYLYKSQKAIDWQDDMFGADVLSQSHNLSISGGTDKTKYSLSGTYDYNGGLMDNNDFRRIAILFKLQHELSKHISMGMNVRVNDQLVNGQGTQGGTYKIRTTQAITSVATKGLSGMTTPDFSTMTDEEIDEYQRNNMSLAEQAAMYWKKKKTRQYNFNGNIDIEFIKNLKLRIEGGYGYTFDDTRNWWGATTTNASYVGGLPLADWTKVTSRNLRESVSLSYKYQINDNNKLDIVLGQEFRKTMKDQNYMYGTGYSNALSPDDVFANFGMADNTQSVSSTESPDDVMASYFGRLNYDLMDRYLFTVTFREDGSSKFAKGNRWGFFPAASAAWRISEEAFMDNTREVLSNLKLRLSYGKVGNNKIASNSFIQLYEASSANVKHYGVGESANNHLYTTSTLANPNLTWEKRTTRNIGLDFGFLHERINGTVEFYWNNTDDLLIQHSVAAPGYSTVYENSASTSNKGLEFSINAAIVQTDDLNIGFNFNIAFDKSKVEDLANGLSEMTFQSGWAGTDNKNQDDYIVRVGEPIGLVYGWETEGYYTTNDFETFTGTEYVLKDGQPTTGLLGGTIGIRPGTIKLKDRNNDGTIDANDITVIGDVNPDFLGGFGFSADYKGFDFNANFTYSVGGELYNATKIATTQQYRSGTYPNMLDIMAPSNAYSYLNPETGQLLTSLEDLAYWNEGGNGKGAKQMWSPYSFGQAVVMPTDWAMEDASYLRLQSVTLGYTLPKEITKKAYIQKARVYFTVNNLFCLTNYSGYDPEVSSYARNSSYSGLTPGIDYSSYPKSRGFTCGLNLTF